MKKNSFFAGIALCLISCIQPLSALPTEGEFLFEFGSMGTGNGQFMGPRGLAINEYDEIIVSDFLNKRVQVFDRCGNFLFTFGETGSGPGQFEGPADIAITEDNNIIVVDSTNENIQVYNRWGEFLYTFGKAGGAGNGSFDQPTHGAVNEWGDIFIIDDLFTIQAFDRHGNFIFQSNGGPQVAGGIAINSDGIIYIGDGVGAEINVFDRCGRFLFGFGSSGSGPGQFLGLVSLAVSESGEVITGDNFSDRVQVFDACGDFLFEFGENGSDPGKFDGITGVAVNRDGDIYVSDFDNSRIQVFRGQTPTKH